MNMETTRDRGGLVRNAVITAACLALLAGTAAGQDRKPAPGNRGEPALKGPPVREGGVPGEQRRFAGGGEGGPKERMQRDIPHRAFVRAFEVLRRDEAGEDVRLTQRQDEKLRSLGEGFREEMEDYRAEHRKEVEKLARQLPPEDRRRVEGFLNGPREPGAREGQQRGGPGGGQRGPGGQERRPEGDMDAPPRQGRPNQGEKPDRRPEGDDAQAQEARQRLKEIMEGAPRAADVHAKMFSVLTAEQRPLVEKELERVRGELERRRSMGGPDGERPNGQGPGPGGADGPRMSEEGRERLKNMSPEERERFKQEVRERRGAGKGKAPPARPEPKDDDR